MSEESFWPTDALKPQYIRTPTTILTVQGTALESLTNGLLKCEVRAMPTQPSLASMAGLVNTNSKIERFFQLIAPQLNNYRFELLRFEHDIMLYPIKVKAFYGDTFEAVNEAEFIGILKKIFQHPEAMKLMQSLVNQSAVVRS